jgi:hypothetical protein
MELNEIKKNLYKSKPSANIVHIRKDGILYSTQIIGDKTIGNDRATYEYIYFNVPLSDMGETAFLASMPAQLLIRYIMVNEPNY